MTLDELRVADAIVERRLRGAARRSDPETSREAAASVSSGVMRAVWLAHAEHQGMTDDELVAAVGMMSYLRGTIVSARSRLVRANMLTDSGARRPSDRGRSQIVWERKETR